MKSPALYIYIKYSSCNAVLTYTQAQRGLPSTPAILHKGRGIFDPPLYWSTPAIFLFDFFWKRKTMTNFELRRYGMCGEERQQHDFEKTMEKIHILPI